MRPGFPIYGKAAVQRLVASGEENMSLTAFRVVLVIAGAFVIFLGLNVALGGMPTMKWLGERDFFAVTDEAQYRLIDNHIRFFGGLFAASGLFLILAASDPVATGRACCWFSRRFSRAVSRGFRRRRCRSCSRRKSSIRSRPNSS